MIVRVATLNNFNCSQKEFNQLNTIDQELVNDQFFINTNIRSINKKTADRINSNKYPIVITFNPDLKIDYDYLNKISLINPNKIAFIRVKFIPEDKDIEKIINILSKDFKIVLTLMRFIGKTSLEKYAGNLKECYQWEGSFYRLKKEFYPVKSNNVFICDENHGGCDTCYQCTKFTYNTISPVNEINLSSSGNCKFNCPDCFAKKCLKQSQGKIAYDKIKRNDKMKGKLKHYKTA